MRSDISNFCFIAQRMLGTDLQVQQPLGRRLRECQQSRFEAEQDGPPTARLQEVRLLYFEDCFNLKMSTYLLIIFV